MTDGRRAVRYDAALAQLSYSEIRSPIAGVVADYAGWRAGIGVVGFIGLYPERKGLPTISDAVQLLRHAGYDVRLHIIGKCPIEISQRDGVTHYGVIDKSAHMGRFLEILRNTDVGFQRAARMEVATRRRIERARDLALGLGARGDDGAMERVGDRGEHAGASHRAARRSPPDLTPSVTRVSYRRHARR